MNQIETKSKDSPIPSSELGGRDRVQAAFMCLQNARDEVVGLEIIQEVVSEILGSEELAIFKVGAEKDALWLHWCAGIDPDRYVYLDVTQNPILNRVLAGEIVATSGKGEEKLLSIQDPVTVLIPLLVEGAVKAILVIFRLLPEKTAFDAVDREVCQVLSTCAGRTIL